MNVPDLSAIQWGLKGAQEAINIHPLFVHFPIALLLTSLAFYLLGVALKKEQFLSAGKWTLVAGAMASVLTVWTGLRAAQTVSHDGGVHELMTFHQYFGYSILGLSAILSLWVLVSRTNLPGRSRGLFLVLMILLGMLVIQGVDLGGRMVFLDGVGVGRKSVAGEITAVGHHHDSHAGGHERGSEDGHH